MFLIVYRTITEILERLDLTLSKLSVKFPLDTIRGSVKVEVVVCFKAALQFMLIR